MKVLRTERASWQEPLMKELTHLHGEQILCDPGMADG